MFYRVTHSDPPLFAVAIHPEIGSALQSTESSFPGAVDSSVFYLVDGVVAGHSNAVAHFFDTLETGLARIGLTVAQNKPTVSPSCNTAHNFSAAQFLGCVVLSVPIQASGSGCGQQRVV